MKNYMGDDMPKMPWMINYTNSPTKDFTAYTNTYLDYQCNLNVETKLGRTTLTKIMCFLGVYNIDITLIEELLKEGISCVCIDTSASDISEQMKLLISIHKAVKSFNRYCARIFPFAVALELVNLRIRTGSIYKDLGTNITLNENDVIFLTIKDEYKCHCDKTFIYIDFDILKFIKSNWKIYLDYGEIELNVTDVKRECCKCIVKKGGIFKSNCIVHIPAIPPKYYYNKKEDEVIRMGIENKADIFIISPTRSSEDVKRVRKLFGELPRSKTVLAKIEEMSGVNHIAEIIKEADGIIISRAELSIDLPPQKLFIIQKSMIAQCNRVGKPVFCSSYVLQSLAKSDTPSRAEILDVSNAILDGTDGFLLTEDVAQGTNPKAALKLLRKICMEAEASIFQKQVFSNLAVPSPMPPTHSIAISAVDNAMKSNAACIIILTVSGRNAKLIAQFRPPCPIIAVTRYGNVSRKLNIWRGVIPMLYIAIPEEKWEKDVDKRFLYAMTYGKCCGLIKGGDAVVLVSSWAEGSGFTNTVRIVYASQNNAPKAKKKK